MARRGRGLLLADLAVGPALQVERPQRADQPPAHRRRRRRRDGPAPAHSGGGGAPRVRRVLARRRRCWAGRPGRKGKWLRAGSLRWGRGFMSGNYNQINKQANKINKEIKRRLGVSFTVLSASAVSSQRCPGTLARCHAGGGQLGPAVPLGVFGAPRLRLRPALLRAGAVGFLPGDVLKVAGSPRVCCTQPFQSLFNPILSFWREV